MGGGAIDVRRIQGGDEVGGGSPGFCGCCNKTFYLVDFAAPGVRQCRPWCVNRREGNNTRGPAQFACFSRRPILSDADAALLQHFHLVSRAATTASFVIVFAYDVAAASWWLRSGKRSSPKRRQLPPRHRQLGVAGGGSVLRGRLPSSTERAAR